mgnify:CR=1 FL=1
MRLDIDEKNYKAVSSNCYDRLMIMSGLLLTRPDTKEPINYKDFRQIV